MTTDPRMTPNPAGNAALDSAMDAAAAHIEAARDSAADAGYSAAQAEWLAAVRKLAAAMHQAHALAAACGDAALAALAEGGYAPPACYHCRDPRFIPTKLCELCDRPLCDRCAYNCPDYNRCESCGKPVAVPAARCADDPRCVAEMTA